MGRTGRGSCSRRLRRAKYLIDTFSHSVFYSHIPSSARWGFIYECTLDGVLCGVLTLSQGYLGELASEQAGVPMYVLLGAFEFEGMQCNAMEWHATQCFRTSWIREYRAWQGEARRGDGSRISTSHLWQLTGWLVVWLASWLMLISFYRIGTFTMTNRV